MLEKHDCMGGNETCDSCGMLKHKCTDLKYTSNFICIICIVQSQIRAMRENPKPIVPYKILCHDKLFGITARQQDCPTIITYHVLELMLKNQGSSCSYFICKHCEFDRSQSPTATIALDLSFTNVNSSTDLSLEMMINNYFTQETVEVNCTNCNHHLALKKEILFTVPDYLQISLKRYSFDSKISDKVSFDDTLTLKNEIFYLVSVITHIGNSTSHGHYICFIKIENHWWKFDDVNVTQTDWDNVKDQEAYILYFSKNNNCKHVKHISNTKERVANGVNNLMYSLVKEEQTKLNEAILKLSHEFGINPHVVSITPDGNCLLNAISLSDQYRSVRELKVLCRQSFYRNRHDDSYRNAFWYYNDEDDENKLLEVLNPEKNAWARNFDIGLIAPIKQKNSSY